MNLFCVRHGETYYNLEGRIQGQSNSHLSPLGKRQCESVASALANMDFDAIVASPLSRAIESAQYLADALKLEIQTDPRLMEINAGIFQGHTWDEIGQRYPEEAAQWRAANADFRIPDGESRRDLMQRTGEAFRAIHAAGHSQVVVVAHGGSLSAALKSLLDIPAQHNPFSFSNGSISRLAWGSEVRVLALNQTAHLHHLISGDGDL